jgi:DNA repair ATPase RecN
MLKEWAEFHTKHETELSNEQKELSIVRRHKFEEKLKKVQERLDTIAKREEELAVLEAAVEQVQTNRKTYEDLCRHVQELGTKINNAVREMKSMKAGKGGPEHAFKRFERRYSGPELKTML